METLTIQQSDIGHLKVLTSLNTWSINEIHFADGTVMGFDQWIQLAFKVSTTDQDDLLAPENNYQGLLPNYDGLLYTGAGNDVIKAKDYYNSSLYGGAGDETASKAVMARIF